MAEVVTRTETFEVFFDGSVLLVTSKAYPHRDTVAGAACRIIHRFVDALDAEERDAARREVARMREHMLAHGAMSVEIEERSDAAPLPQPMPDSAFLMPCFGCKAQHFIDESRAEGIAIEGPRDVLLLGVALGRVCDDMLGKDVVDEGLCEAHRETFGKLLRSVAMVKVEGERGIAMNRLDDLEFGDRVETNEHHHIRFSGRVAGFDALRRLVQVRADDGHWLAIPVQHLRKVTR